MWWHISNDHWLWSPPAHWQGLKNSHCGRIRRTFHTSTGGSSMVQLIKMFQLDSVNLEQLRRTKNISTVVPHGIVGWSKKQVNTYTLIHSRFRLASYQITNPKMKWMMRTPTRMFRSVRCELRLGVSIGHRVHPRKANMGFMIVCRCLSFSKGVTSGSVLVICGCVLSPSIFRYKAVD